MVNRSSILPIEKINFFPYAEDVAYLRAKYGSGAPSSSRMGYGPAMREIIHAAVKKLREKERMRIDATTAPTSTITIRSESEYALNSTE